MPIVAHEAICQQIMRTVNRAGYWSQKQLDADPRIKSRKHHGFDMGKLTPSSLFYLPCQAQNPARQLLHRPQLGQPQFRSIRIEWAGYAANHHRPEPEPSATAAVVADRRRTSAATDATDELPQAPAGCAR